jgi:hypothetical protein
MLGKSGSDATHAIWPRDKKQNRRIEKNKQLFGSMYANVYSKTLVSTWSKSFIPATTQEWQYVD